MTEPAAPPPTPPPPPAAPEPASNRNLMVVLSYLWILVLVPLLVEEKDEEVRWHAKHGLVLMGAEFGLWILIQLGLFVSGGLGCLLAPFIFMAFVAFVLVRVACIVKGLNGGRLRLPLVTPLVDRF